MKLYEVKFFFNILKVSDHLRTKIIRETSAIITFKNNTISPVIGIEQTTLPTLLSTNIQGREIPFI